MQLSLNGQRVTQAPEPLSSHDFLNIFESRSSCDYTLLMNDGVQIRAHKAVLIGGSPVFASILAKIVPKTTRTIEIPNFDSTTMTELLRFMYFDDVKNMNEKLVFELIVAANTYQVKQLKEICEDYIVSNITEKNLIDTLVLCPRLSGMHRIFQSCVDFIVRLVYSGVYYFPLISLVSLLQKLQQTAREQRMEMFAEPHVN